MTDRELNDLTAQWHTSRTQVANKRASLAEEIAHEDKLCRALINELQRRNMARPA
jgi:hypothetical protein